MTGFGAKLRAKRREQMMTLRQLAEKTNLSVSLLSEIERGLAQPSMASLNKIAHAMDISLFGFRNERPQKSPLRFPEPRHSDPNGYVRDVRVVRAGSRKKFAFPHNPAVYELLTPDLNRLIEVSYVKYAPGLNSGLEPIIDPPGERFIFVLHGSMKYRLGEETVHLNEGDAAYYPADLPIFFQVMGSETCELIVVCTPPSF
jgi:transcriptional regulator with XRE-family HTH domain